MKKIVLSAIAVLVLSVGAYHAALLMGAREGAAALIAALTALTAAFVTVGAAALIAAAAVAAVAALAAAAFVTVGVAALAAFAALTALTALAIVGFAFAFAAAAKEERVRFRWVAPAYTVIALAVWGALTVGNTGWSAAIALAGVAALLVLWRLAPEPSPQERAAAAQGAKRAALEARIADLEGELADKRARLVALDAPPSTGAVPERNGA